MNYVALHCMLTQLYQMNVSHHHTGLWVTSLLHFELLLDAILDSAILMFISAIMQA